MHDDQHTAPAQHAGALVRQDQKGAIDRQTGKLLWMQCLVRAVETGSFSAVARELGIGQPNVSRHIASLEKALDTRLIHRSTRQLVATPEGQRYYTQARLALDLIAQADSDA